MRPSLLRKLLFALIALILICCTASAYLAWNGGHRPKAISTLAAGVAFSIMIGSRAMRRS